MKTISKLLWIQLVLFCIGIPLAPPQARSESDEVEDQKRVLVGRISHVEGQVFRYVPEENDWATTVTDAPFYTDDLVGSDENGRAEFIMPNNTWVRIDDDTQIRLNVLEDDLTEIDVSFGLVRFYNKGSYAVLKATTPFGYVMAPENTSFDVYVGSDSVEVIALQGTLDFFYSTSETRFEVIAGKASILADRHQVTIGLGDVDAGWDRWNRDREHLWATRSRTSGESIIYLPPSLHYEAYVLEEHGRWERVYYDGAYAYFWRPVYVGVGWSPFTVGRWTACYGEHVWIPCEPFGYITHHYGNWVFIRGLWYWAPPVARVRVWAAPPLLDIGFAWYPGRVAWIYSGVYIRWVPLAPHEPYYCHRRWGPGTVVVKNVNINHVHINRYSYAKHAVIINRSELYRVENYRKVRVGSIRNATLEKNYRAAPVLKDRMIKDYKDTTQRDRFTDVHVQQEPRRAVTNTLQPRHAVLKQRVDDKSRAGRNNVADPRESRPVGKAGVSLSEKNDRLTRAIQPGRSVVEAKLYERGYKKKSSLGTRATMDTRKHMPIEDQRRVQTKDQGERGGPLTTLRNQPSLQAQNSKSGRATKQETMQDAATWQSQPRQQNNRRSAGRERNMAGRSFQPDVSAWSRAASPRSRFVFANE